MLTESLFFPPVAQSRSDGMLAVGGELAPDWLLDAYSHGIFPWPITDRYHRFSQLVWWSPDPRGVLEWDKIHLPKRLLRTVRNGPFEISCDTDFAGVIRGCAGSRNGDSATWITPEMIDAYIRLHELGWAHSVEAKLDGRLVGGVYGVAINGLFAAESMFYVVPNASKVALVRLLDHLHIRGYGLIDIQMVTENTARFGATEIPRRQYLRRLKKALQQTDVTFGGDMGTFPIPQTAFRLESH